MTYTLLHNPGCSTSRKGLELLHESGIQPQVRKYMNVSEQLSLEELVDLAAKLGGVAPRHFLRQKSAAEAGLSDTASDAEVFAAMAENPKLIERPIGIKGKKAALGRPVERLFDII
jgi:arsenate reductase